jgi:hypothetical protein
MLCPNCTAETPDDAAFCPACGAELEQPAPEPDDAPPAADDFAARQAAYEAELADYQWKQAAYEQQQYAAQQAAAVASGQQPKKSKAGLVIAILALVLIVLAACGVGGVFAVRMLKNRVPAIETPDAASDAAEDVTDDIAPDAVGTGHTSAEEALLAQMDSDGISDWAYQVYDEGDGYVVYWTGPPNSEWVSAYRVEEGADGSWSVAEVTDVAVSGDAAGEAEQTVWEYLTAVYEDRGLDAQAWTVPPFSQDSASAQVSAGGLTDFWLEQTTEQSDGSYWIQTTQTWYGENQNWQYWVVPTEAGYRIADVQSW